MAKRVLMVFSQPPAPDVSAGEYRVHTLLTELAARNETFFLPLLGTGPDKKKHADALRRAGITVVSRGFDRGAPASFTRLLKRLRIETVLFPFYWAALPLILYVPEGVTKIIDTHDLAYIRAGRKSQVKRTAGLKAYARAIKERELLAYRLADHLIAINDREAALLRAELPGARVSVLPTPVQELPPYRGRKGRNHVVFFGYFPHCPNQDAAEYFAASIFPRIRARIDGVQCHFGGHGADTLLARLQGPSIRVGGRVKDLHAYLGRFRVFAAPLRYGAGSKKKITDAMANGIPVVTTAVGAEGMGLTDGRNVLIADNPRAFAEKICALYTDGALWRKISVNGYRWARRFTSPAHAGALLHTIVES